MGRRPVRTVTCASISTALRAVAATVTMAADAPLFGPIAPAPVRGTGVYAKR